MKTVKVFREGDPYSDGRVIESGALKLPEGRVPFTTRVTELKNTIGYAENFRRGEDGWIVADVTITSKIPEDDLNLDWSSVGGYATHISGMSIDDDDLLHITEGQVRAVTINHKLKDVE